MKLHHFRPKREKRGLLYKVFIIVAILQIGLLLTFSGYVVTMSIIEPENKFDAPPTLEKVDNAPKEQRVRVQQQQKKSRRVTKRIEIANPTNVNTPDVKIEIPASFGTGGGITTVSERDMTAGMKISIPTLDFMGIKSKAERVLICLDAGPYLMTDERGGLDTYKVIREDIKKLVNGLPSTVLFNLMAFDVSNGTTINFFQRSLVAATAFNKRIAADWINPINVSLNKIGPGPNNYKLKYEFLPQPPQSPEYNPYKSNIYRIYQAALEQGADTIYILTTNWVDPEEIKMPWTDAEIERYRKAQERYAKEVERQRRAAGWNDDKQQEYDRKVAEARAAGIKKAREWIKNENARRKQKNIPLYTGTPEQAMWENKFYVEPTPRPPAVKAKKPEAKFKSYGRVGLFKYYNKLFKEVYFDKNMKPPVVNMIVFKGEKEEWTAEQNKIIRSFTAANNNGRSRVLKGLKPVSEYD